MPLNSINIGTSGLVGFSKELQTISNNVANLNTTGFKGSNSQFAALFSAGGDAAGTGAGAQAGAGLATLPSMIDFSQGQVNQTGSDLDVAINGSGFFVLKDTAGHLLYTRDGHFNFDAKGILVNGSGDHVQALGADGSLQDITLEGRRTSAASASTAIKVSGTLSTADTTKTVSGVTVTDAAGGTHTLSIEFKNNTAVTAGSWLVTVKDGATSVGTGEIRYNAGTLDPAHASVAFSYGPAGVPALPLTITVDAASTSAASGASTMALGSVDGWGVGALTGATFDSDGKLVISYANSQKSKDQQLALATFGSTSALSQAGGATFRAADPHAATLGVAGGAGSTLATDSLEGSNVDLSKQFSAIIITQRGYQASSELISTANQMLDTLMHMKG
ncbi:MAG: flagellar basal-body rod protein FlgF [Telluria sp.]